MRAILEDSIDQHRLTGALVILKQGDTELSRDSEGQNGEYNFPLDLTKGEYSIEISLPHHHDLKYPFSVGEGGKLEVEKVKCVNAGETVKVTLGANILRVSLNLILTPVISRIIPRGKDNIFRICGEPSYPISDAEEIKLLLPKEYEPRGDGQDQVLKNIECDFFIDLAKKDGNAWWARRKIMAVINKLLKDDGTEYTPPAGSKGNPQKNISIYWSITNPSSADAKFYDASKKKYVDTIVSKTDISGLTEVEIAHPSKNPSNGENHITIQVDVEPTTSSSFSKQITLNILRNPPNIRLIDDVIIPKDQSRPDHILVYQPANWTQSDAVRELQELLDQVVSRHKGIRTGGGTNQFRFLSKNGKYRSGTKKTVGFFINRFKNFANYDSLNPDINSDLKKYILTEYTNFDYESGKIVDSHLLVGETFDDSSIDVIDGLYELYTGVVRKLIEGMTNIAQEYFDCDVRWLHRPIHRPYTVGAGAPRNDRIHAENWGTFRGNGVAYSWRCKDTVEKFKAALTDNSLISGRNPRTSTTAIANQLNVSIGGEPFQTIQLPVINNDGVRLSSEIQQAVRNLNAANPANQNLYDNFTASYELIRRRDYRYVLMTLPGFRVLIDSAPSNDASTNLRLDSAHRVPDRLLPDEIFNWDQYGRRTPIPRALRGASFSNCETLGRIPGRTANDDANPLIAGEDSWTDSGHYIGIDCSGFVQQCIKGARMRLRIGQNADGSIIYDDIVIVPDSILRSISYVSRGMASHAVGSGGFIGDNAVARAIPYRHNDQRRNWLRKGDLIRSPGHIVWVLGGNPWAGDPNDILITPADMDYNTPPIPPDRRPRFEVANAWGADHYYNQASNRIHPNDQFIRKTIRMPFYWWRANIRNLNLGRIFIWV